MWLLPRLPEQTMHQDHEQYRPADPGSVEDNILSPDQITDLDDEVKQAEYRRAYQRQLDRRACPGCGEP
jgi:hypothetical protein